MEKQKGNPRSWKYYLSITLMWVFCLIASLGCMLVWLLLLKNLVLAGVFGLAAAVNLLTVISYAARTWHYYEVQRE